VERRNLTKTRLWAIRVSTAAEQRNLNNWRCRISSLWTEVPTSYETSKAQSIVTAALVTRSYLMRRLGRHFQRCLLPVSIEVSEDGHKSLHATTSERALNLLPRSLYLIRKTQIKVLSVCRICYSIISHALQETRTEHQFHSSPPHSTEANTINDSIAKESRRVD